MAIISPLAYTIANGDPVDATPVQANLSQIVQDVNANAAPIAGSASQQFLVATTANPAGAVPLAQAQQQFAALNGSSSQPFSGATLTVTETIAEQNITALPTDYDTDQAFVYESTVATSGITFSANDSRIMAAGVGPNGPFIRCPQKPLDLTSTGGVAVPGATASNQAPQLAQTIGAGATAYTDQTANRVLGTTYTNTTNRPIFILVTVHVNALAGQVYSSVLYVGGVNVLMSEVSNTLTSTISMYMPLSAIVPPGSTYQVTSQGDSIFTWYEY